MKKTLMCAAVGLFAVSGSMDAAKVYFDNEGTGWEKVYGYSWNPSYDQELTSEIIDGHTLYVAELDNEKIILRGSNTLWADSLQTNDLPVTDGAVYSKKNLKSEGTDIYPVANIIDGVYTPVGEIEVKYAKIYIPASEWDYDVCNIYSWEPYLFGNWPGTAMKKVTVNNLSDDNESSYWMVEIDENLIKNTPVGGWKVNAGDGKEQSSNIENGTVFQNDYVYHLTDGTSHLLGEHAESPLDPTDYTKVYLMSDRYNFATSADLLFKTEDGVTYTLNLPDAGSDIAFKFMAKLPTGDKWFSNGQQNIPNGTVTISKDEQRNMTLHTGGNVTFTIKNINDFSAIELTVEGQDPDADPYPAIYFVSKKTNWEAEEAHRLTTTDGVNYSIEIENLSGDEPFYFEGGDAHNYKFSNGEQNMVNGEYELKAGENVGNMTLDNGGNVTFNFVLGEMHASAKLTISGQEESEEEEFPRMYLIGERTDWNIQEAYRMSTTDGKTYTLNVPTMSTKDFRFCGRTTSITNVGGAGKKLADGTYELTAGKVNMTLAKGGNVTFTLTSEDNFETATLVVEGQGEIEEPTEPTYENEFYIRGNIFGVKEWSDEKMTYTDGKFVLSNKKVITGSFGIKEVDPTITEPGANAQVGWYSAQNAGEADVVLDKTIDLVGEGGTNLNLYAGTYTFTFDPEALTLVVSGTQTEFPEAGFNGWTVTLAGNHNDFNATDPAYTVPVSEDGKAQLSIIGLTPQTGFKFVVNKPNETWYGITDPIVFDKPLTLGDTGMSNPVIPDANPKYKYTFDVDLNSKPYTVVVTQDTSTGISSLDADSAEAIYFNLQGIRVENPESGLYIVVRNGKTSKEVVK